MASRALRAGARRNEMVNGNIFRPRTRSLDQTGETYEYTTLYLRRATVLVCGSSVVKLILNKLSVDYVFIDKMDHRSGHPPPAPSPPLDAPPINNIR